jgi:hypothetical protein
MKGPRRARMPVYRAGSKYLGRTEKETDQRLAWRVRGNEVLVGALGQGATCRMGTRPFSIPALAGAMTARAPDRTQ